MTLYVKTQPERRGSGRSLEKEMAAAAAAAAAAKSLQSCPTLCDPIDGSHGYHSRILTWRIPWTEEPGGL